MLLGPRSVGRPGESSEEKSTPSSPTVLAWRGWGPSLFRAPSSCRGLPSVRGPHSWRGGDLGFLGGYVNPLGKPKTGELSKQDTKLEPRTLLGRRIRKGCFSSWSEEKNNFCWVKGQRLGDFPGGPVTKNLSSHCRFNPGSGN